LPGIPKLEHDRAAGERWEQFGNEQAQLLEGEVACRARKKEGKKKKIRFSMVFSLFGTW